VRKLHTTSSTRSGLDLVVNGLDLVNHVLDFNPRVILSPCFVTLSTFYINLSQNLSFDAVNTEMLLSSQAAEYLVSDCHAQTGY